MALTKAKIEVYRIGLSMIFEIFNKFMQFVLAAFALWMFAKSFDKYIMSTTPFDKDKWGAANLTFLSMIFVVYAYFFKKEDKKEGSKMDKIVDALINKWSGNNPPTTPSNTP